MAGRVFGIVICVGFTDVNSDSDAFLFQVFAVEETYTMP